MPSKSASRAWACDPVDDGDHREVGTPRLAGGRVDRGWSGRAVATAEIVQADNKVFVGIERSAGADDVVPPTDIVGLVGVMAGDMVMAGEGVANENGVRLGGVERAVGLIDQIVSGQNPPLRKCSGWSKWARCDLTTPTDCPGMLFLKTKTQLAEKGFLNANWVVPVLAVFI
jgi:hypothetical protein